MRLPVLITLLCMTLAASARAQVTALDYVVPNPDSLRFNPTATGSPYPFRALPTLNTPAAPCPNTEFTQPGLGYTRCFKSFPQFFNPVTPSSGGYDLKVTNCNAGNIALQMKFALTQNTALLLPNIGMPTSRLQYSVDSGDWTPVPTVLTDFSINPANSGYRTIKPNITPNCLNPRTVQVRFRLKLEGDESATGANYTSAVDFRIR